MRVNFVKKGQFLLLLSFAALVISGALLLMLPGILKQGTLSWVDALFMSCSAVCLCGLTTVSVTDFSLSGQIILVLLIQFGCVGIVSLTAMILLALGKSLSFSDTLMLSNLNERFTLRGAVSLTQTALFYMLFCEAVGMAAMFIGFLCQGPGGQGILLWLGNSFWNSLFLSVASFCNSGLSPLPNSMADAGIFVQAVSCVLMILGGLGAYVVFDFYYYFRDKRPRMRLHSRIVLWTTLVLLVGGTCALWLCSRIGDSVPLGIFDSFFMSVTSRTTGFCTVDPGVLSPSCQVVLIILMLIGGSPGSAAGGMKTSTIAVVFAALIASFKGENSVIIGRRTIALQSVLRAFTIMVIFVLTTCIGSLVLQVFSSDLEMIKCFFEASSALTTTGLSTGNTTQLWNVGGKILLTCFMFAGRVGPLTVILFFIGREKSDTLRYPQENVIVG